MPFEVKSLDLAAWADELPARSQLPRLLRRLVLLYQHLRRVEFAADEDTQMGGFDGVVDATDEHPFVPAGVSVWELGVNKDVKKKANDDYTKRTDDSPEKPAQGDESAPDAEEGEAEIQAAEPPLNRPDTTFVFVTPRRWGGKAKWLKDRNQEGKWKEVRAYDAGDLATWLEDAPSVTVWLSTLMGKRPQGALDFERAWLEYAQVTRPETSPALTLAGRTEARDRLLGFLTDDAGMLSIQAESRDEALAFLLGTVQALAGDDREAVLARGVIVTSADAWRALVGSRIPMILVPTFEERSGLPGAGAQGHHVVVPLGAGEIARGDVIQLTRPRRMAVHKALEGMGVAETRVSSLARLGRRSQLALRRQIAVSPELRTPPWADPAAVTFPVAAILAGTWQDDNPDDQRALTQLTGLEYPGLAQTIIRWASTTDPPFRRVARTWLVSAPEDAWNLTAHLLTSQNLDAFEEVASEVLGGVDAQVNVPPAERVLAGLTAAPRPFSDLLRQGVADTLALMAARDDELPGVDHLDLQARASRVVTKLLDQGATWQNWASLWRLLPRLAEAAPLAFLKAVNRHTTEPDVELKALFQDAEDTWFSTSPHVGLLWALEALAWSPAYLTPAVRSLAILALHDIPEAKTTNRPLSSLKSILGGLRPNTTATLEQRFAALDAVRGVNPDLGWQVTCDLMPEHQMFWTLTSTPTWRDWVPEQYPQASAEEYERFRRGIVDRLLEDARPKPERLSFLLRVARFLNREEQGRLVTSLEASADAGLDPEARDVLQDRVRECLRDEVEGETRAAFSPQDMGRLRAVAHKLTPGDVVERHAWLFTPAPALPDVSRFDHEAYFKAVYVAQVAATREVYEQAGVDSILRLARSVQLPARVGEALGEAPVLNEASDEDALLAQTLGTPELWADNLGRGFIRGRYGRSGKAWLDFKRRGVVHTWSPRQQAALYLMLPHGRATWDDVQQLGAETERLYWEEVGPYGISARDGEFAARQFLTHGRIFAALTVITMRDAREGLTDAVAVELLEVLLQTRPIKTNDDTQGPRYALPALFRSLERGGEVAVERLANLEWQYLSLFPRHGSLPGILHQHLETSPEFFVEVLSKIYPPDGEDAPEVSPEVAEVARKGSLLLREWRGFPGRTEDGGLREVEFTAWAQGVWAQAGAARLTRAAETQLAPLLARSPGGADGSWPHPAVRGFIERVASDRLDHLLGSAVYNRRGVVSKVLDAGGDQERALAENFRAYANSARQSQPRTASILDDIASTYAGEAKHEDAEAELGQDLWD